MNDDVCYYCGEDMDDEGPCSENEDKPHESQHEVDEMMNRTMHERERGLQDLMDKVSALSETSDGVKLL